MTGAPRNPASEPLPVGIDVSAIPTARGGAGTYVRALVSHLPVQGIAPVLVARRDPGEDWLGAGRVLAEAPQLRPLRLVWEQTGLVRALHGDAPDVRVLHSPHYTMPLRPGPDLARVVTVHDLTFFTRPLDHQRSKRWLFRTAIRAAARSADAIVAVSAATADVLQSVAPPRCRVAVIPHGVDHDWFRPATPEDDHPDAAELAQLGIDRPFILHLGTIEPRKNLGNLLRAYDMLCARMGSDAPLLVLAGGAWRGEWERLATLAQGVDERSGGGVRRLGHVPDDAVPALYRRAAVVAYPSLEEGYGLPVVEALACGAPVVTTAGSVMHELGGDAVTVADGRDPAALCTAIAAAMHGEGPSASTRLARAARYRWDASAAAHAALYRSLV